MINWLKSLLGIPAMQDSIVTLQGELDSLQAFVESALSQGTRGLLAKGQVFLKDLDVTDLLNVNDIALTGNMLTFRFGSKNLTGNDGKVLFALPPEIAGKIRLAGWQNIMLGACQFENGSGADFTLGTVELTKTDAGRLALQFKFRKLGQPGDDSKARLLSNKSTAGDWPYNLQYGLLLEGFAVLT